MVKERGLAGVSTLFLNYDEVNNTCCQKLKFPLIKFINENLIL
jgi:hypothetical protein